jgi:transcriptional regulator with XRE-family HTH domain
LAPPPNPLRELRRARGLTLQAVADLAGTTKGQIERLENGTRRLTPDWAKRLAPLYQVTPLELLPPDVIAGLLTEDQIRLLDIYANTPKYLRCKLLLVASAFLK